MSRRGRRGAFLGSAGRGSVARFSTLYGPTPTDVMLVIDQPVLLDIDALVHGMEIEGAGELIFDPGASRLLQVDQQRPVCVMEGGHLEMVPASASIVHELRFVNVDESLYTIGGGMNHTANPGLCVENGTVKLQGAAKRGWTRTTGALLVGATSCTVVDATGWRIGDEIVITPTQATSVPSHWGHDDRRTLTNVVGNTLTFAALTWPHPSNTSPTGTVIYPEVLNLTRNVKVSGQDASHRAQIMFMEDCTGTVLEYFEGRYLGPRKMQSGSPQTQVILGRYSLHFHKMAEGARDINVTGVSLHDLGSKGYVPHGSHGMTFYDCVLWDYFSDGYWWDTQFLIESELDPTDASNDLLYDRCFSGRGRYLDINPGGVGMAAFQMAGGVNMTCRNCCAAGNFGATNSSGYVWPAGLNHVPNNVWNFHDNDAHNNRESGIFVWQNDANSHETDRFRGWNNDEFGIDHGAYVNMYHYNDCELWGNGNVDFSQNANSYAAIGARQLQISGGVTGIVRIFHHSVAGGPNNPTSYINTVVNGVIVQEGPRDFADGSNSKPTATDFVNCGLHPDDVTIVFADPDTIIRIQTGASAWQITIDPDQVTKIVTSIPLFA